MRKNARNIFVAIIILACAILFASCEAIKAQKITNTDSNQWNQGGLRNRVVQNGGNN